MLSSNFAQKFFLVKKPQWITVIAGLVLTALLYFGVTIIPNKKKIDPTTTTPQAMPLQAGISTDSLLFQAKKQLSAAQIKSVTALEKNLTAATNNTEKLKAYHELAHFWMDTAHFYEPYLWYEAESARLENSEKSLTFAAHQLLESLRETNSALPLNQWKALQAKDLFERSLKINPANDSSTVGLGACYLFGGITAAPMEGIMKVRSVAEKDSNNVFAQEVLANGAMMTGQYDKAISRFEKVYNLTNDKPLVKVQASLMLAEAFERTEKKDEAIKWYQASLPLLTNKDIKAEVEQRISDLKK